MNESMQVGDSESIEWVFKQKDVKLFSEIVGDRNPLHVDEKFAEDSLFGELITHGVLGLGVLSAALARLPGTIIFKNIDASFKNPVFINSTVFAVVEVVENIENNEFSVDITLEVDAEVAISGEARIISH
jgi:3-hydroxybutyryl-CoA dehydratase